MSARCILVSCLSALLLSSGSWSQARGQKIENVTLLDTLNPQAPSNYNDIWGFVDEFGNEYALLGVHTGLSIINVTVPTAVYETGFIAGVASIWRDVKAYGDYAYTVTEGSGGGLQVIDLSNPESPTIAATAFPFDTAHNLYIDEASGRAYACGMNTNNGGVVVLDLAADPLNPPILGAWNSTYVHDLYVEADVGYIAEIYVSGFSIIDFSNPAFPTRDAGPISYPTAFTHSTWLHSASNTLFTTDENRSGHVRLWDVSSLPTVTQLGEFQTNEGTIVHNVTVRDDKAYISYYEEGLRIVDFSDSSAPAQVGAYDSSLLPEGNYDGAWGVYPFLPSGNILISDVQDGLIVLEHTDVYGLVQGTITEDGVGDPVVGADISIVENTKEFVATGVGSYTMASAPGAYTLQVEAFGFATQLIPFNINQGVTTALNVSLVRLPNATLIGTVRGTDGSPLPFDLGEARVEILGTPLVTSSAADGSWSIPQTPLDPYTMRVTRNGFGRADFDITVESGGSGQDALLTASHLYLPGDDATGWTIGMFGDTAIRGLWDHGVPIPSGGGLVQPGEDDTPDNTDNLCFFTANAPGPGSSIGAQDVDGGFTTLLSPVLDTTGLADPHVAYSRWYVNEAGGQAASDIFTVEISDDAGLSWEILEQIGQDATPWTHVTFRVADFVNAATGTVRLKFTADDAPSGSVVEALIDDVEIYDPTGAIVGAAPQPTALRSALHSPYPNPFNPATEISFRVGKAGKVRLTIVDLRGRQVATLLNEHMDAGPHKVSWRALDDRGEGVSSGVYLAILTAPDAKSVRKLVLTK